MASCGKCGSIVIADQSCILCGDPSTATQHAAASEGISSSSPERASSSRGLPVQRIHDLDQSFCDAPAPISGALVPSRIGEGNVIATFARSSGVSLDLGSTSPVAFDRHWFSSAGYKTTSLNPIYALCIDGQQSSSGGVLECVTGGHKTELREMDYTARLIELVSANVVESFEVPSVCPPVIRLDSDEASYDNKTLQLQVAEYAMPDTYTYLHFREDLGEHGPNWCDAPTPIPQAAAGATEPRTYVIRELPRASNPGIATASSTPGFTHLTCLEYTETNVFDCKYTGGAIVHSSEGLFTAVVVDLATGQVVARSEAPGFEPCDHFLLDLDSRTGPKTHQFPKMPGELATFVDTTVRGG